MFSVTLSPASMRVLTALLNDALHVDSDAAFLLRQAQKELAHATPSGPSESHPHNILPLKRAHGE